MPDWNDPRIAEGVALFNAREYFACHDVWEDFWDELVVEEKSCFQGLIQAAVALFHFTEGNLGGARRMYFSSCRYMQPFDRIVAGIDVPDLIRQMDICFAELSEVQSGYPANLRPRPGTLPVIRHCSGSTDG